MTAKANMRAASAVPAAVRVLPFTERMGVVTELTVALDLATRSGQQHLMNKVLTILRREVGDAEGPAGRSDLAAVSNAMADLEQEAGRISPLANAFNRHAQVVIDALLRSGRDECHQDPDGVRQGADAVTGRRDR